MKSSDKKTIGMIAAIMVLAGGTAAVASYVTQNSMQPKTVVKAETKPQHYQKVAAAQPAAAPAPQCNDHNIVGTIAGGAAGGIVGSQIGNGGGKTAATIGGVIGGAYLGNQYIPTHNATCR